MVFYHNLESNFKVFQINWFIEIEEHSNFNLEI